MKTIELTDQRGRKTFVVVDKIFDIKAKQKGGSFITSLGGDIANVMESPEEINNMIKQL